MSMVFAGFLFWGILALVLLGWLVPLVVGVRRRRRSGHGGVLIGLGAAWGALAAGLVVLGVNAARQYSRHFGLEAAAFDAATFKGDVATLAFAYGYAGELEFFHEGPSGASRWRSVVSNGVAVVPAGRLTVEDMSLTVTDACGRAQGTLYVRLQATNSVFSLSARDERRMAGAFPLTASIEADKGDGGLSLNFTMSDTAGNRFVWYPEGERRPPAFEAAAPGGKCFWRDNFEYG